MTRTNIKFCGITTIDDYIFISDQEDVNFIGLIFTDKSPRSLNIMNANKILNSTSKQKSIVGVFMDQSESYIQNIINNVPLDILQFHGNETLDFCKKFDKPFIKTLHINDKLLDFNLDFQKYINHFLIDTTFNNMHGGTGKIFNWKLLSTDPSISHLIQKNPCFIAGGLNPENIGDLISTYKPYGVDVSSGLESSVGKKDHLLMKKFLENVRISEKDHNEKN
jgi:phosphoribosylanthranilate isomerase